MRFGVLGTGFWAEEIHAASLAEHPDAQLVGVWGRDEAKARAVADRFEVRGTADLDDLLARVGGGLKDSAYIVPGLGEAGDRQFGAV